MSNIVKEVTFQSTSRIYVANYPNALNDKFDIMNDINKSLSVYEGNNQNIRTDFYWGLTSTNTKNLLIWIKKTFQEIFTPNSVGKSYDPTLFQITECWANKYSIDSYAVMHNHFPYCYSFIYYVNIPKNSSPTYFDGLGEIEAKEGQCIFFPGFITHGVPKTNFNDRITIAGNFLYLKTSDCHIGGGNFERWNNYA